MTDQTPSPPTHKCLQSQTDPQYPSPPESADKFSINSIIKFGWQAAKNNLSFFIVLIVIVILVNLFLAALSSAIPERMILLSFFFNVFTSVIGMIVQIGIIKIALGIHDNKKMEYSELFSNTDLLVNFFLGSLLYSLIVGAGFLLFIIPGIIWAIKFQFFDYLIVEQNLKPMEAIKRSGALTKGYKFRLFGLMVVIVFINLAGLLALGIGLLFTVPVSLMAMVRAYRVLLAKSEANTV